MLLPWFPKCGSGGKLSGLPLISCPESLFVTTIDSPKVLLVEDTALVATMIETLIEDMGWTVVGPMARLNTALAAARDESADAAIVDVNLGGEAAWEVASILRE